MPNYSAGSYAAYLSEAEKVAAATSPAAMRAAFFQGHVKLIGLAPDGSMAPPVTPGSGELVTPPSGVTSVFALGVILNFEHRRHPGGQPGAQGRRTAAGHGAGARGARPTRWWRPRSSARRAASWPRRPKGPTEVAAQHGVSPGAITRANPGKDWSKAKGGDHVLVPAH